MKPTLLSLLSIIFVLAARAQDPVIEWQNTIGGDTIDYLYSIQQTADGGYILGGESVSGISGDKTEAAQGGNDYWVIKLDAAGNIAWQNTIGGNDFDRLTSIQQTTDGGYILGGYSDSGISGDKTEAVQGAQGRYDYWVIQLDAAGNIVWQNTIGGSSWDYLTSIQQTADGGYILGGYSQSGISGDKTEASYGIASPDYWIIKLDVAGNIVWQNTIGGSNHDFLNAIRQTTDGGYILGGNSQSGISGDKTEANLDTIGSTFPTSDYWVIKLDAAGNIIWQNTIGGGDNDHLYSIQQTANGGYILGGYSESGVSGDKTEAGHGNFDYWIIKLDATGNIVWQNTIGGNQNDELRSIQQTADGGYILGGDSGSGISGDKTEAVQGTQGISDYWVIKLDSLGDIVWQKTIGGTSSDRFYSIQQTADGGYFLGGASNSGISGDQTEAPQGYYDYWVIKLSSDLHNISGQLLTETGIPIQGVAVTLSGDDTDSVTTDTTGYYSFNVDPGGNFTITPSKNNDAVANNGISSIDILLMRAHILGTVPLNSPYKIIAAAEVNADGDTTITTQDILFTRSLILGNITSFPNNRLWQFVSSDYVFPDTQHPFPFDKTRTYTNITTNQTNQNFIGIKLGDVNGSWDGNVP